MAIVADYESNLNFVEKAMFDLEKKVLLAIKDSLATLANDTKKSASNAIKKQLNKPTDYVANPNVWVEKINEAKLELDLRPRNGPREYLDFASGADNSDHIPDSITRRMRKRSGPLRIRHDEQMVFYRGTNKASEQIPEAIYRRFNSERFDEKGNGKTMYIYRSRRGKVIVIDRRTLKPILINARIRKPSPDATLKLDPVADNAGHGWSQKLDEALGRIKF